MAMDLCEDFLTSLPIESGIDIDDLTSTSWSSSSELLNGDVCMPNPIMEQQHKHQLTKYPNSNEDISYRSSSSSMDSSDLNFFSDTFKTINPDDFLNDFFKSEVKSEMSDSPNRDTPSPSSNCSSGSSSDFNEFRIDMPLNSFDSNQCQSQYIFDTPPISPPSPTCSTSSSSQSHVYATSVVQTIPIQTAPVTATRALIQPTKVNILQGTLIPISAVPITMTTATTVSSQNFKKIKIQPKPIHTGPIITKKLNGQAKTIILSANDYSALVEKCKMQKSTAAMGGSQIILKAAGTLKAQMNGGPVTLKPISATQLDKLMPTQTPTARPTVSTKGSPMITPPKPPTTALSTAKRIQFSGNGAVIQLPELSTIVNSNITVTKALTNRSGLHRSLRHDIEEKLIKKHHRMIKNRESACLSRKKKKDYMTSLENRVTILTEENEKLKSENGFLRDRLTQLENVMCKCGKTLNRQISTMINPTNKKNATFLLAMIFMVSLNFGPIGNLFANQMVAQNPSIPIHHSRSLLWVDEDDNQTTSSNLSSLYNDSSSTADTTNPYPTCPLYVNQTESVRLASELRRWIGDLPEYLNVSSRASLQQNPFDLNTISNYLFNDDTIKSLFHQIRNVNNYVNRKSRRRPATPVQQDLVPHSTDQSVISKPTSNKMQVYNPDVMHAIQYAELFEELRRQDDTFYVVSFSGDHLLLPALAHNKTFRPKMSLMLPSVGINGTYSPDHITLMQIDCEVVNTSLIQIKEKLIPKHLRNKTSAPANGTQSTAAGNSNSAKRSDSRTYQRTETSKFKHSENVSSEATVAAKEFNSHYKPYFVDKAFENRKLEVSP